MSIAQQIRTQVEAFAEGEVFKYDALNYPPDKFLAVSKTLSRLVKDGEIRRLMKGRFYRPRLSVFGELPPTDEEVLKEYLFEGGERIGYPSGLALYNNLGLTLQVPTLYTIAGKYTSKVRRIGNTKFELVKSQVPVSEENYELLSLLDAIRDLKRIPDFDYSQGMIRMKWLIEGIPEDDIEELSFWAIRYPPRTIALLGAILDEVHPEFDTSDLLKKLKPNHQFNVSLNEGSLKYQAKWNLT